MKLTDKQINCAVEWWKNAITGIPKFDMGDSGDVGLSAMMLATMAHQDLSLDVLERFGDNLRRALSEDRPWYSIGVDYDPDPILAKAFEQAGGGDSSKTVFPWKTVMWFRNGGVSIRHGYNADVEELLKEEDD